MCGFFARARDWDIESIPPTITATEKKKIHRKEILNFFPKFTEQLLKPIVDF